MKPVGENQPVRTLQKKVLYHAFVSKETDKVRLDNQTKLVNYLNAAVDFNFIVKQKKVISKKTKHMKETTNQLHELTEGLRSIKRSLATISGQLNTLIILKKRKRTQSSSSSSSSSSSGSSSSSSSDDSHTSKNSEAKSLKKESPKETIKLSDSDSEHSPNANFRRQKRS